MDLSKLSIEPRLRNGWQAIDLGFVMTRHWWWSCFLAWAIPSFIVFSLLSLLFYRQAWLAMLLIWWLKPLWDRLPLLVASRALFGETPGLQATFHDLFRHGRTDLFASLSYRRFSFSRSFDLPVTVLEGLRKGERRKRLAVLHQRYGNAATLLTFVGMHVEMLISAGIIMTVVMLLPSELQGDSFAFLFSDNLLIQHVANFTMWLAMALVAPFYCVAGFSLYVNRRIQLEGWDIEIRFRHLLARYSTKLKRSTACVLPLLASGLLLLHSEGGWAETAVDSPEFLNDYYQQLNDDQWAADSKQDIVEVLSSPDFFQVETEWKWRFKGSEEREESLDSIDKLIDLIHKWYQLSEPLREGLKSFAGLFEVAVWLLLAAIIAYLLYKYRRGLAQVFRYGGRSAIRGSAPESLFGLDVREESLPADVCKQVLQLWDQGRGREALGLLYRASLSRLIYQFSFEFAPGFTEQECIAVVEQGNNVALSQYMKQLTPTWQRLAYAHHLPQREQVIALCATWTAVFEEAKHAA